LARVLTAFLDLDLDAVDRVRVGSDGSLESSGCLEVDKSAVLATADVKVLNLAVLSKSSLQGSVVNLTVDVLDVSALLVGVSGRSGILCTGLLLLVSSGCLPASGLALACRGGLVTGRS
jgi:hypothetical protein